MAGFSTCIIFVSVFCQLTGTGAQDRDWKDLQQTVTETSGTLKEVVGALDGSVTFTLNFTEKQVDTIIWTFKQLALAIVSKDSVKVLKNDIKNRTVFLNDNYSMILKQLKKKDSGIYRAEIYGTSLQSPFIQEYVLYVYEYLSRPKVTMDEQDKNGTCITNLTCSMEEGGENVTYSWRGTEQGVEEFHDGAVLPISWRLGEKDKTFICTARNPISHSSSIPILVQNLCEDTAKDLNSSRFILYILPVCLVLSILVLIIPLVMRTKKGKGSKGDTKRVDGLQEKPNFCPDLEEKAEYDIIPYTNEVSLGEDTTNTLYFTVQIPKAVKSPSSLTAMPHMPSPLSYEHVI